MIDKIIIYTVLGVMWLVAVASTLYMVYWLVILICGDLIKRRKNK